jgi:hypothetical protein
MVMCTLERYHCTIAEVREDYWLGRAWRALAYDPDLVTRVARVGVGNILITGPHFGAASPSGRERSHWRKRVIERLAIDTGRSADTLGLAVQFAEEPVGTAQGCILSLIAQTVLSSNRWDDLARYADDLQPVVVPVAFSTESIVAA